jgi:hypothetical protein
MALSNLGGEKQSGRSTPTIVEGLNVASSSIPDPWFYTIAGSIVTCAGKLIVDPTTGSTLTTLTLSLPFSKDFTDANDIGGLGASVLGSFASIVADTVNNTAQVAFICAASGAEETLDIIFRYDTE